MGALDRYYERQKKRGGNYTSGSGALDRYNEHQRYNSIDTTGVDQKYLDSFISDANAFLTTAEKDYGGLGWGNAASVYEGKNTSWQDLNTRADTIGAWLYKNRDRIDDESYESIGKMLSDVRSGGSSVVDAFKQSMDYYANWQTEDDYNTWYAAEQKKEETKKNALGAADFEEYFSKANEDGKEQSVWDRLLGRPYNNVAYMHNTPGAIEDYEDMAKSANGGSLGTPERILTNQLAYKAAKHMTEEEFKVYNYFYGKDMEDGTDTAQKFLESMEETLNYRAADERFADLEGRPFKELLFGISAGLDQFESGLINLFDKSDYIPASPTQIVSGKVREDLADNGPMLPEWMGGASLGQMGYDMVTTTSNMMPSILTSAAANMLVPGSGAIIGSGLLGASASGNAYAEMLNLGYDKGQARAYSSFVGASEAVLQYALGGIGKLGGKLTGNAVSKFVSQFDNAIARVAIKLGGNMLSEGLEESLQSVLEPIFKSITTGEEFEGIAWDEVLYSGIMGAMSALILEGGSTISGEINTYKQGKALKSMGTESIDRLVNLGKTYSADTVAYQLAGKVNENTGAYTIGRLLNEVGASLSEQNKTDIAKALEAKSMPSKAANTISKWLGKAVDGGYFTKRQIAALENNEIISSVFKDVIIDQNSTVNQRIQGYNENLRSLADAMSRGKTAKQGAVQQENGTPATETPSVTENAPVEQIATESKLEAAESGKTVYNDVQGNVRDANIKRIASTDGGIKVELESGEIVKASDLNFGTREEALMYEMVARMEATPETANEIMSTFKPSNFMEATNFFTSVPLAYQYGKINYEAGLGNVALPGGLEKIAYNRGRMDAMLQDKSNTKPVAKKGGSKASVSKSVIIFEDGYVYDESKANDLQKASMAGIEAINKMSNLEVHVYESKLVNGKRVAIVNGKEVTANGFFLEGGNKIYIDINAGNGGEGAMSYTMSHEVGHYIRNWNAKGFREIGDFLVGEYGKGGTPVQALLGEQKRKLKERYARSGEAMPSEAKLDDMAYEEMVCDAVSEMLADPMAYEKLAKLKQKDRTLWEKIGEAIKALLDKLKTALGVYKEKDVSTTKEALFVRGFSKEAYDKLQDLYIKAFAEADENYGALAESGIIVDSKTESATLMSVRDVLSDEERKKVAKALAERFGVTQTEAMDWLKAETSLASLILNPKYSQYLDYTADPNEEAIKSNSDYPQGTVDFSNICKKRRDFTEVMNRVLRNFPNHVFAATDLAKIRTIMEEEGMEVACAICYVEDRRQLDSVVAQDFIDSLAIYRDGGKNRPDGKPFNANQLKAFSLIEGDTYTPSIYELISLEGRNALKAKNPAMEQAWVKFNNARGMQSVRLLLNDAEYKRQILKYTPAVVKRKNDLGGLRIYSFSDAEMFHLIDIIQVITDSATVGLSLQGYTKVNEYAKAVKDTGEKLNRSLIPKGDLGYHMEDGRVVLDFDTTEGIDINHPDFFDNIDNPNIGNIVIGINATQIKAAMTSKFIDQIIPFHTGQSGEVLGEKGIAAWENYKDSQSERDVKTGKKSSHQINIYTEVINAAEAEGKPITNKVDFVNKFLEVCKKNNLIPRFSEFLNVNENGEYVYTEGYHKLLVDFKTFAQTEVGEYLPQMPVKPIFDNEYITGLLTDYVKSQKAKDAETAKSMPKVLDRITKEIVKPGETKYSERYTITQEDYQRMEEHFGTTNNYEVAGWLLPNGKMLDFSGKHWGGPADEGRFVDHRDIDEVLNLGTTKYGDYLGYMAMLSNGNVRLQQMAGDSGGIHIESLPNKKQMSTLRGFCNHYGGDIVVDAYNNANGQRYDMVYHRGTSSAKIVADIEAFYTKGEIPSRTSTISQFRYSERDSLGNELSEEQAEFFKDSKVRDKKGNLMVLYHGTPRAGFTSFDASKGRYGGNWFTTSRKDADSYAGNYQHKLFDPNETDDIRSSYGGNYTLNSWMRFDSEEDRANFLKMYPNAESIKTDADYDALLREAEKARDWDEYDRLESEQYENRKELKKIEKAYGRYEWEHSREATIGELFEHPERFSVNDVLRAWDALDSNNAARDEEYTKEDLIEGLREEHNRLIEEGEEGLGDFIFKARLPVGENGEIVNRANNRTYAVYANLTHPYTFNANARTLHGADLYPIIERAMKDTSYDGVIVRNARVGAYEETGDVVIIKDGGQVKLTSNKNPTQGNDIRYSERTSDERLDKLLEELLLDIDWGDLTKFGGDSDVSIEDISEKLDASPKKIEILIRRKGLGESHIEAGRIAVMKQARIDEAIEDSGAKHHPDYARKYIARISPKDFIDITVSQNHLDRGEFDAEVKGDYGSKMSEYDYEKALQDSRSPYLSVDRSTGKVIGHNGRHRMRALEMAGIEAVEIEVQFFDEDGDLIKYNAETIPDMAISSQFDTAIETRLANVIPLNEAHRAEIERIYGEKANPNAGVKYQERESTSVSNRSLLSGALEGVAQNDIEKQKLGQYKAKIAQVEEEQKRLGEIRAEANKLRFTKGRTAEETKRMRELDAEATKIANRISTYDKQLLGLESTKALKGVLEREKANLKKRLEAEGRKALSEQRQKNAEAVKGIVTHYQESRKKAVEGRNKTAMRHKIQGVVKELNEYLLKGTKDKHVPIGLQKAVAEALDAVNMDTVGAEERIAKKRDEMMKAKSPEVIERLAKEIETIQEMGGNMARKLSHLKTAYDGIIDSEDPLVAGSHDEVISNTIERVMATVGDTALRDMSLGQLESVYDMYRMVLHSIRAANKAFKAKKSEAISEIAGRVMLEIGNLGKKKPLQTKLGQGISSFDWNNQKPVYAFERIGSKTFTEVFNNVRAGEDTWAVDMTEAQAFREEQYKKHKYDAWDFKKRFKFTSASGMDFELTLDQIMSLYAYSKRDQAAEHLKRGGIVFDETTKVTVKNKLGIPVEFNPTEATAYNISEMTLAEIVSKLTAEQKAFVDEMQDYLSTVMGEKGNEVSLALYDVKLFKEKNYFPLKSATQFMAKAKEQQKGEVKIKNSGFTKETVRNANNPIVLTPFMDVWAGHVNEMSMYHAFTLALEDFYRVYNYKTPTSETAATESVEMFLQNAHGKAAAKYIDQLLRDLNGGARVDSTAGIINKMTGLFKKSAVFASASVVIQQPSSIARAAALVDTKYFVGKPSGHKETWAEVKKYAPVAIIKEMGYFDTGMGKSSVEWLKGEKTLKDRIDDFASKAPALADEYAWCAIWNAVKRETFHNNPTLKPDSEEFLRLCGERFTEVVTKTQVYDSVLSRSANMRSKDTGMKMATAFMGEPTTSLNMLENALIQGKRGNKKEAVKAIGGVISSMILNAILVSIVYAGRDDDEEKTYAEKYVNTLTEELLDSFNPLTLIPFAKDLVSIAQGYDVERSDMAVVTDLINAWNNLDSDNRSTYRKVEDFGGAIAAIFGLPVKNVMRDARGMYNTVNSFINGDKTTGAGIGNAIEEAVTGTEKSNGQQLYEAMVKGDSAQIRRIEGRFESQSAISSAIRKALRENDPRIHKAAQARYEGDISEYTRIAREIVAEGKFRQDDVVAAINAEMSAIKKGETSPKEETEEKDEVTSIYSASDINAAFESRDDEMALEIINDLIDTKVANGKTEKEAKSSLRSSMTSYWKPLYKAAYQSGDNAEMLRIRRVLLASGLYGSSTDVVKTARDWLKN